MKTPSLPEAAKLAREMLKRCQRDGLTDEEWKATLAALDAALAASAEPREPVAWRHSHTHCLYETEDEVELADGDSWAEPLYLAPPAQAEPSAQEPADTVPTRGGLSVKEFSRSIEAAISNEGVDK